MPVLPASGSITIPQPLEPDIELLRQSGNLSGSLLRPELFSGSNCSTCFNQSEENIDEDAVLGVHSAAPQWVGLISHGLVYYTFPVMVAFGVLSGLINVLVLVRQTNKSSYDAYLVWLIGLGVVLLLCGITLRLTDYIGHSNTYQYMYGYTRGVKEWAWYSSIWTLVMMSLEKVLATKFRFRGSSGRRQASTVSAVVCGVCFVSSLPHFFEYEVTETFDYASNQTLSMCQLSEEAKTYEYSTVYYWYVIVLTMIFPLPLLLSMLMFLVWDQQRRHRDAASTDAGATLAASKPSLQSSSSAVGNGILLQRKSTVGDGVVHRVSVALIVLHLLLTTPLSLLNSVNGLDVPQWTWTQNEFNSVAYPLSEFSFYCYFVTFLPLLFSYSDRFHKTLLRTFGCGRCAVVKPQKTVKFDIRTVEIEIRC